MTGYLVSFTVYTLAMIGIIFIAFVVAKKCMLTGNFNNKNDQFLSIESSLSMGPRKMLYVIKAGNEKFLISSDVEKSTFLTKLESEKRPAYEEYEIDNKTDFDVDSLISDFTKDIARKKTGSNSSMMRGISKLISETRS